MTTDLHFCPGEEGGEGGGRKRGRGGQLVRRNTAIKAPVDKSTPANTLSIVVFRRTDFRFRGPEGYERRVDTEIPSHKTNFRNLERLRIEFAKAPKFSVSIEPSYSDRTYRDLVRNLNGFF